MTRLFTLFRRLFSLVLPSLSPWQDVSTLIAQAPPDGDLSAQVEWLDSLLSWVRSTARVRHEFDKTTGQLHWVRLKFLFQLLDRNPKWKSAVAKTLRAILAETSGVQLFSRTGLTQEGGLFSEIIDRCLKKALPAPPRERDLDDLLPRLFRSENDAVWVENLPGEVTADLLALIAFESETKPFDHIRGSIFDSLTVLAQEVAARGVGHDLRTRLPFSSPNQSPFLALRRRVEAIVTSLRERPGEVAASCDEDLESCFGAIERIYQHLDEQGVSVGLVYSLECQRSALARIAVLLDLLRPGDRDRYFNLVNRFLGQLIRESLGAVKVRHLLHNNLRLLSQKIVERAGASGEHYITRTREEYRQMFHAGLGGGAFTVLTTLLKFVISASRLPLFFEGLFASLNYAGSFVTMQLLGFTLATKQPAMTGPALAGKLRHLESQEDIEAFVDEVCRLTRSQFAAVFGNIGATVPIAFLVDLTLYWTYGSHFLEPAKAVYVMRSLDPFSSLTIPFAAWTGVTLWTAGIVAGWVENWIVFRQLPEAIAQHRLLATLAGRRRCEKMSDWFLHNIGSLSSSVSLGFMLGFTPVVGLFFGVPFDVRHVTLSSAGLALATGSLIGPRFDYVLFLLAVLGILVILTLNFTVSFALAFMVAVRAREVSRDSVITLLRCTAIALKQRPLSFFVLR